MGLLRSCRAFSKGMGIPSVAEDEVKEFNRPFYENVEPQFLRPLWKTIKLQLISTVMFRPVLSIFESLFSDLAVDLAPHVQDD